MNQWIIKSVACMVLMGTVAACNSSTGSNRDSVWSTYDYRHAPPGAAPVQPTYDYYYQDNDEYYTPPSSFGCNPDNIHMCE